MPFKRACSHGSPSAVNIEGGLVVGVTQRQHPVSVEVCFRMVASTASLSLLAGRFPALILPRRSELHVLVTESHFYMFSVPRHLQADNNTFYDRD